MLYTMIASQCTVYKLFLASLCDGNNLKSYLTGLGSTRGEVIGSVG